MERVLASSDFSVSKRCRDFLCYIVKETIAGRADRIKAYSIAIEVFGRDERFSPDDPVVRIEAGRLRRALERYYLLSGKRDLVRIDIPKGAYVPNFNFGRSEPKSRAVQPDALRRRPLLVIKRFFGLGESAVSEACAAGLTEELSTVLPKFGELAVRSALDCDPVELEAAASREDRDAGAQYCLHGGVQSFGPHLHITVRLSELRSKTIVWSRTYKHENGDGDLLTVQTDVVESIAREVASPDGVIRQRERAHTPPDGTGPGPTPGL